jgi:hypothetical protein
MARLGTGKVGVNVDLITQAYEVNETTTRIGFAGEAFNLIEVPEPLDTQFSQRLRLNSPKGPKGQRRPADVIAGPRCSCTLRVSIVRRSSAGSVRAG